MRRRIAVPAAAGWQVAPLLGIVLPFVLLGTAAPLAAQDEEALKRYFEGRRVVVRIDMPATSDGVDVYPERERPLDWDKLGSRIRGAGVAVREGDRLTVTKVKVKDDLIEFQLGGGGFNAFHDSSSSVSIPRAPKTSREHELEREIKHETDSYRRRSMQRELDDLRHERERADDQARAVEQVANEERRERDRQRALDMGSRFNIRYEDHVPARVLMPEGLMHALSAYVEFPGTGYREAERAEDLRYERSDRSDERVNPSDRGPADTRESAAAALDGLVRKGMSRAEVEDVCGRAEREDAREEGALRLTVASYRRGSDRVEVTYVDDVAVRVTPLERR
jgi:hypothetical protein